MSQKICSNCRWWKDAGLVAHREPPVYVQVRGIGLETRGPKALGYCEPQILVHGFVEGPACHQGLTAEDYTCGEWKERGDE